MSSAIQAVNTELPEPVARRGMNEAQWRTLANNLYPGADPHSVLMVWDYCAARKLDPMKKPCHIVPMNVKNAKTGEYEWRDVVMPGIYEYRITAQRTGEYLGHSKPDYGPTIVHLGVSAPEWCEITVYRYNRYGPSNRAEYPVRRRFEEVVGLNKKGAVNERWSKSPCQMLEKCTEAAALREAFPEEIGGEPTADEMDGQAVIEATAPKSIASPRPALRKSEQSQIVGSELRVDATQVAADIERMAATERETVPVKTEPVTTVAKVEEPKPTEQPSNIGKVTEVVQRENATTIHLDSGFFCATRDANSVAAALQLKEAGVVVEVVFESPKDPTKHAKKLVEFMVKDSGEVKP